MLRPTGATILAVGLLSVTAAAYADEPETASAALRAAKRIAQCPGCDFEFGPGARSSARRGLVDVAVGAPSGGGYHMILAYTGTQWSRLWEGNGSTQNLERLPGKVVICMDQGGWTNVRRGPGLDYPRAGKVRQPTAAKALEARLTKALGKTPGEAWYRIPYGGRFGWVQNLRTMRPWLDGSSPTQTCRDWRRYYANHVAAGLREAQEESPRGSLQWGHEPVRGNVPLGQRAVSVDESLSRGHSGRGLIPGEGRE